MNMAKLSTIVLAFALLVAGSGYLMSTDARAGEVRKIALHVDDNDKARMNLALNNAENVYNYYKSKGETVQVRIVAYGPGLHMLRADTSPVKERIAQMALQQEGISFAACSNTQRKMGKKEGKKPPIISEAKMVPSGVVELVELQRQGWMYIKP
jgi:intracellular sulfur oxidation DsrE/DsrF family protein